MQIFLRSHVKCRQKFRVPKKCICSVHIVHFYRLLQVSDAGHHSHSKTQLPAGLLSFILSFLVSNSQEETFSWLSREKILRASPPSKCAFVFRIQFLFKKVLLFSICENCVKALLRWFASFRKHNCKQKFVNKSL